MSVAQAYLYEEIAESIRRQIVEGELNVGDRLPPVRALAIDWSCTPGTVHRAYRILSAEGLIVSRRGKGTRVAPNPLQPAASGATQKSQAQRVQWAALVHRAEQYLLEAARSGYSVDEAQVAMSVAVSRWRSLREPAAGDDQSKAAVNVLRFSGSHDLVVEHLAHRLEQKTPVLVMQLRFTGSMGGLLAILRGEADLAGIHLWDAESDSYNDPYVRRLFPGKTLWLMTLTHRRLGMIVPKGAAGDWPSLEVLAKRSVRIANRQRGSGTRMWLDAQLRDLNIAGDDIAGYGSELTTHVAVAEQIAAGKADVGIGIQAVADAMSLDFVPLAKERYDLVFPSHAWERPDVKAVRQLVCTKDFQQAVAAMGGYDVHETGRVRRV